MFIQRQGPREAELSKASHGTATAAMIEILLGLAVLPLAFLFDVGALDERTTERTHDQPILRRRGVAHTLRFYCQSRDCVRGGVMVQGGHECNTHR
jgi:hypothetical protein